MTPRCSVCGTFTTHYCVDVPSSWPGGGIDREDWFCPAHDPRAVAWAGAPDPAHPDADENEPGRYGY